MKSKFSFFPFFIYGNKPDQYKRAKDFGDIEEYYDKQLYTCFCFRAKTYNVQILLFNLNF